MSTLAACRADNFYRPADYDPKNRVYIIKTNSNLTLRKKKQIKNEKKAN